ncbi:hypothetical protein [Bacillus gaemokensis]|uniref:hypothetical protein n=1 Tax=Bacillus gaemokensis TaxID=574375 RepID=UPI00068DAD8E|nr:hypothetical protein [Bacillus gaemokensis]KYG32572.1 hypothetical protein AZF08_10725 [Bacillus gaemokensis]
MIKGSKKYIWDFTAFRRNPQPLPQKATTKVLFTLFQDDEETFQFGLAQVNGNYYYTEPDIHPIVDDCYKNLYGQEE